MADDPDITSVQNPLIRQFISLKERKKTRTNSDQFVLEGLREFSLALKGGYKPDIIFICTNILTESLNFKLLSSLPSSTRVLTVSNKVYERIAYRGKTEGLVGIFATKEHPLEALDLQADNPLILIAESPEKPGNIGAMLRTADAAGIDAVIIAEPKGDLYNPNVVRSSIGCLFTVPVAVGSNEEVLHFIKENNIRVFAASLQTKTVYHSMDFTPPTAFVVGQESTGLTPFWYRHSYESISIPMAGSIDSMNVSVSAAILIFEAKRQRLGSAWAELN